MSEVSQAAQVMVGAAAGRELVELLRLEARGAAGLGEFWGRFVRRAGRLLGVRRRQQQRIALAGWRLRRALLTGRGAVSGRGPGGTVEGLRAGFRDVVGEAAPRALRGQVADSQLPAGAPSRRVAPYRPVSSRGDDVVLPGDDLLGRIEEALRAEEAAAEKAFAEAIRAVEARIAERLKADAQASLEEAVEAEEASVGLLGEEAANTAGRAVGEAVARVDRRVVAWARVASPSATGPCGFCALMLSRGAVFKTAKTAGRGRQWHRNCRCRVEPLYSDSEYENDPRFDLNRWYRSLYDGEFAKLPRRERLTAWRNEIDFRNGVVSRRRVRRGRGA